MPSAEFEQAAADVKKLKAKPTDDELLQLYGLFKQVTSGDNDTPKPGTFDFKGKYKWQAWEDAKGKTTEEAEKEYIEYVDKLKAKHGF